MVWEVGMLSGRVRTGLCVLVAVIWAASVSRQIIDPAYKPDPFINTIFGSVIGFVIAMGKNDDKDNPKDSGKSRKGRS